MELFFLLRESIKSTYIFIISYSGGIQSKVKKNQTNGIVNYSLLTINLFDGNMDLTIDLLESPEKQKQVWRNLRLFINLAYTADYYIAIVIHSFIFDLFD